MSREGKKEPGNSNPSSSCEPTLQNLITNVRTGQLTTGPLMANRWLVYAARDKTDQERKMERAMESCTFKAIMSFVIGKVIYVRTYSTIMCYLLNILWSVQVYTDPARSFSHLKFVARARARAFTCLNACRECLGLCNLQL